VVYTQTQKLNFIHAIDIARTVATPERPTKVWSELCNFFWEFSIRSVVGNEKHRDKFI